MDVCVLKPTGSKTLVSNNIVSTIIYRLALSAKTLHDILLRKSQKKTVLYSASNCFRFVFRRKHSVLVVKSLYKITNLFIVHHNLSRHVLLFDYVPFQTIPKL